MEDGSPPQLSPVILSLPKCSRIKQETIMMIIIIIFFNESKVIQGQPRRYCYNKMRNSLVATKIVLDNIQIERNDKSPEMILVIC